MKKHIVLLLIGFLILVSFCVNAQTFSLNVTEAKSPKLFLYSLQGEKTLLIDSLDGWSQNNYKYNLEKLSNGFYRISFYQNRIIDFIYDGKDVVLNTNVNFLLDSMNVISSESNKLLYQFIRLNQQYKTKNELLQLIINRYPKEYPYYQKTKERLNELQNEYIEFVNITAQKEPGSFIARYIFSSQLPIIDVIIPQEKQLDFLKANALNKVDFNDAALTKSDIYTNKTIEYLTYFRNPQLPKELLEKEFMKAVDTLLNKAKVNQLVYQHITEYLIDGFKKFGFDQILDYIVENYVIKDDLCLDEQTEDMIKRRIDQARILKIGSIAPNFIAPDVNNSKVELSKLDADKILLVFYASWCPHCKELLPQLNSLKKDLVGKKFEVIAISLDTEKEEWSNIIKECSSLINVSDLKGWESNVAGDYIIYATPTMFLLDREKKIIGKPLNLEELKRKIM